MDDNLPSFTNPPLVETALSAMFTPIRGLGNADLGLFWGTVAKDEFPEKSDADAIPTQIERFGEGVRRVPRMPFRLVPFKAGTRLQMMKQGGGNLMIQVQNGRFAYNWRRLEDGTYPHWGEVFHAFRIWLGRFADFIAAQGLGQLVPNQWEVAYVNQFFQGRDWDDRSEWDQLLPGLIGTATRLPVGTLEGVHGTWRFALPEQRGRLHLNLEHGISTDDLGDLLTLQLTARGGVGEKPGWDLDSGLRIGHKAVVEAFAGITGKEAHERWGRTR